MINRYPTRHSVATHRPWVSHFGSGPLLALLMGLIVAPAPDARTEIVPLHHVRMGEAEADVQPGTAVFVVHSSTSATNLYANGDAAYTTAGLGAAARDGSSLAVQLNGTESYLYNLGVQPLPGSDFGMEIWVRPDSLPAGFAIVAYSGDTRFNGFGFYQNGAELGVSYGGSGRFGSIVATVGRWVHLAMVMEHGTSTFYSNGVAVATTNLAIASPTKGVAVGAHPQSPPGEYFAGAVDELRLFTFEPGGFRPTDLLVYPPVQTLPPTNIGLETVTMSAQVAPTEVATWAWFEWGPTNGAANGRRTEPAMVPAGASVVTISHTLTSLEPSTWYRFRAAASNSFGVAFGAEQIFNTPFAVTSLASDGPGTLRRALSNAIDGTEIQLTAKGTIQLLGVGLEIGNAVKIVGGDPREHFIDGGGTCRPFTVQLGGALTLEGLTIQNGKARDGKAGYATDQPAGPGEDGGGILNRGDLFLMGCVIRGNAAGRGGDLMVTGGAHATGGFGGRGGGIFVHPAASLVASNCLFYQNRAGDGGRGGPGSTSLRAQNGGVGGSGGGVAGVGTTALINCSVVENTAGQGGAGGDETTANAGAGNGGAGGDGGGLQSTFFNTYVVQCTFSANRAGLPGPAGQGAGGRPGDFGAGGALQSRGVVLVYASTVVSNQAFGTDTSGGLDLNEDDTVVSSLVAGNLASNTALDVVGTFQSGGHNLCGAVEPFVAQFNAWMDSDRFGSPESPLNADVTPLRPYSATTWVHLLRAGSLAINAGTNLALNGIDTSRDQIGGLRPTDNTVDIGACEFTALPAEPIVLTLGAEPGSTPEGLAAPATVLLRGAINPAGFESVAYFEFGQTTNYGQSILVPGRWNGNELSLVQATVAGLTSGTPYHLRFSCSNALTTVHGTDRTFTTTPLRLLGDANGDGIVSSDELGRVLRNYTSALPWLEFAQPAGLGQSNVTFSLLGSIASPIQVEATADHVHWENVGPAVPRFEFLDTNSPAISPRFYRLKVE